jgi:hypothetical protein
LNTYFHYIHGYGRNKHKRDEVTGDDFPAVLCDRAEIAEDRVLALEEIDPDPVREKMADREATLAKDA